MSSLLRTLDLRRCGWLLLAQAAWLAACVMPQVAADAHPMAAPHRALPALGALAAFCIAAGAVLWALDGSPVRTGAKLRGAIGLLLALVGLAGVMMIDAGLAFLGHGEAMRGAGLALLACALADAVVAAALAARLWRRPDRLAPGPTKEPGR